MSVHGCEIEEPKGYSISEVPPQSLDFVWPQVESMVERGLRHGQGVGTTSDEIREGVRDGDMMLWAVHRGDDVQAVVVLSITELQHSRKLFVEMLAGHDMDSWVDAVEKLVIAFKNLIGASCVEASCRKGLAKYLSGRGWTQQAIVMHAPEEV